jgi:hypothetical protein
VYSTVPGHRYETPGPQCASAKMANAATKVRSNTFRLRAFPFSLKERSAANGRAVRPGSPGALGAHLHPVLQGRGGRPDGPGSTCSAPCRAVSPSWRERISWHGTGAFSSSVTARADPVAAAGDPQAIRVTSRTGDARNRSLAPNCNSELSLRRAFTITSMAPGAGWLPAGSVRSLGRILAVCHGDRAG